jgi:hypothetical protein
MYMYIYVYIYIDLDHSPASISGTSGFGLIDALS